jgi:hypothetical protein
MYDLLNFALRDMTHCGAALRRLGEGAQTLEEVANRSVRHLYENLTEGPAGRPACALVRFFKTHPYGGLDTTLQARACAHLPGAAPTPGLRCLTLMATAGDRPEWNDRRASAGHAAIPLPAAELLTSLPMIACLVQQFGLETRAVIDPGPDLLVTAAQATYNVFHVAEARRSPYVPAQADFVEPCGVRSVLGFGGLLPAGQLFAVILFAKVPVSRDTAELFKPLALSVKLAVLPFACGPVFS